MVRKNNKIVIKAYCSALFTGHCTSDQLQEHYQTLLEVRFGFTLPSPNWNGWTKYQLGFQKKTLDSILRIGLVTYFFNLYHVHFTLSIQHLVKDLSHCHLTLTVSSRIYTFFKLCNARREHYASLESVTKFSAAYAMKHICN